jgi:mono/diheme cytochrome c family protein
LGCLACHAHNGPGGKIAAPLNGVGARLTAEELALVIAYPRQRHPGAKMPSYAYLPQAEQAALVEFLQSLK